MLKIDDVVVIYRSYVHEEDVAYSSYRDGDVCIIRRIFEGGTDPWSGRDESENYEVLNERTGETINLPHYVWLKPYNELHEEPYVRKSESELAEARKQAFKEWIELEKAEMEEREGLYGTDELCREYVEEIKELETGYEDEKYTEKYFKTKMKKLLYGFNSCSHKMSKGQIEFRDKLFDKYNNLL